MGVSSWYPSTSAVEFSRGELTGAIGDSVTVLPVVVAVAVLTELPLSLMLLWFGVFQVVWGLHYGVPVSVEPMKALAALLLAGAITTGEFLVGGLLAGGVLLVVGTTGTLNRIERYVGEPVIRGIQLAVALLLLETGFSLGVTDVRLAAVGAAIAVVVIALGHWNLSALLVLLAGGVVAGTQLAGVSGVGLAPLSLVPASLAAFPLPPAGLSPASLTADAVGATVAQLAMTVGNAAIATALLLGDFFDRDVTPDDLATSMGVMNLLAVPLGGLPMCHGSGGVAGKYAFGARTALANVVVGVAYLGVAVTAVGLVMAYPLSMLGVILVLVALQLGRTSLQGSRHALVVGVGLVGLLVDVGVAFVVGIVVHYALDRWRREPA